MNGFTLSLYMQQVIEPYFMYLSANAFNEDKLSLVADQNIPDNSADAGLYIVLCEPDRAGFTLHRQQFKLTVQCAADRLIR